MSIRTAVIGIALFLGLTSGCCSIGTQKNCLVVDTPDALLVADLDKSEDIRELVEKLKEGKKEDLL